MTKYKEGDKVCTVARDGARTAKYWPIWTGAIYQVYARKRDGVLIWKRVGDFGRTASGRRPSFKLQSDLLKDAEYPWLHGVRNNMKVRDNG